MSASFTMYTTTLNEEDYVVLQDGEGEAMVRLAFNAAWAGRVGLGMLQFALGIVPTDDNEEVVTNG